MFNQFGPKVYDGGLTPQSYNSVNVFGNGENALTTADDPSVYMDK